MALAHLTERRQVDETWRTHVIAEWIAAAVRHTVEAKFALRVFDVAVALARRNLDRIAGLAAEDRLALRLIQARQQLLENVQALAHLVHADQVAVIDVAVVAHSYVKFQFRVDAVRLRPANIIRDTTGAQQ